MTTPSTSASESSTPHAPFRYILADYARSNAGKTTLIREVDHLLETVYHAHDVLHYPGESALDPDICLIREIFITTPTGAKLRRTVALISRGDPNSEQPQCLEWAGQNNADVILCACRTRGMTSQEIVDIHNKYHYKLIWFAHFNLEDPEKYPAQLPIINELSAESVIKLLYTLY